MPKECYSKSRLLATSLAIHIDPREPNYTRILHPDPMDDLGEPPEALIEHMACVELQSTSLSPFATPSSHANLLATTRHGLLVVAAATSLSVYSLADLPSSRLVPRASRTLSAPIVHLALVEADHVLLARSDMLHAFHLPSFIAGRTAEMSLPLDGCLVPAATSPAFAVLNGSRVCVGSQLRASLLDVQVDAPLCVAVAPSGTCLAVGTERGSVVLFNMAAQKLATIVEVESGWIPFSIHFADATSLLVSYASNQQVSHVMWPLESRTPDLVIGPPTPFGELCFASLSSPTSSDETEVSSLPVISCCNIPDWNVCLVASSHSTDVEVLARTPQGWQNWKFDEGKSPTLPTDALDNDTKPLGIAVDFSCTSVIPPPDPSAPSISPMPRIIVLTSDFQLLPFSFIDYRPDSRCADVQEPVPLPDPLSEDDPIFAQLESHSTLERTIKSSASPVLSRDKAPRETNSDHSVGSLRSASGSRVVEPKPPLYQPVSHGSAVGVDSSTLNVSSFLPEISVTAPSFLPEIGTTASQSQLRTSGNASSSCNHLRSSEQLQPPLPFLQRTGGAQEGIEETVTSLFSKLFAEESDGMEPRSTSSPSPDIVEKEQLSVVTLEPALRKAALSASGNTPLHLLSSIVAEMKEEVEINSQAEEVTSRELKSLHEEIMAAVNEAKSNLLSLLQRTKKCYEREAVIRKDSSNTLSHMLSLSREYESMSLEFRVREVDGFSRSLRAEDKAVDEQLATKEAEVLQSLASIEDRLESDSLASLRRKNPKELLQQVYSSLSLQGFRIKRVRDLLSALSNRMDEQDKGGRRSDLGLSLARLEKLALADDSSQDVQKSTEKRSERDSLRKKSITSQRNMNVEDSGEETSIENDDSQLLPCDVRTVLRRLAMTGGRADIPADRVDHTHVSNVNARDDYDAGLSNQNQRECIQVGSKARLNMPSSEFSYERERDYQPNPSGSQLNGKFSEPTVSSSLFPQCFSSVPFKSSTEPSFKSFSSVSPTNDGHFSQMTAPHAVEQSLFKQMPSVSVRDQSALTEGNVSASPPSSPLPPKPPAGQSVLPSVKRRGNFAALPPDEHISSKRTSLEMPSSIPFAALPTEQPADKSLLVKGAGTPSPFASIPFASLPPDSNVEKRKDAKQSPVISPTSVPFASLPPDSNNEKRKDSKQPPVISPVSVPFASLPPDSNVEKGKDGMQSPVIAPVKSALPPIPSSDNGPEISRLGLFSRSESEESVSKPNVLPVQFASLPPNGSPKLSENSNPMESLSSKPDSKSKTRSDIFAALPPDSNESSEGQSKNQNDQNGTPPTGLTLSLGSNKDGQNSGLFAALPEVDASFDDSSRQESGPNFLVAAVAEKKEVNDSSSGSFGVFGNTGGFSPSNNNLVFGSGSGDQNSLSFGNSGGFPSFGNVQQSGVSNNQMASFGSNAMSGTNIRDIDKTERSEDESTSEDSDGEPNRFMGGMDTAGNSNMSNSFGASSGSQQSQSAFGFGTQTQNAGNNSSGFGQGNPSPFNTAPQSQGFGQSVAPVAVTGFGAAAQQQSTSGFPTSAFGTSSFGAASNVGFGAGMPVVKFGESNFGNSSFGNTASSGGGTQSPFGNMGGGSGSGFGAGASGGFGPATDSGFGAAAGNGFGAATGVGFGSATGGGFGASNGGFGAVSGGGLGASAGSGFGAASGGGSGFAALAASSSGQQTQGGSQLIFGSGGGPPSFTSAAFSQRRG